MLQKKNMKWFVYLLCCHSLASSMSLLNQDEESKSDVAPKNHKNELSSDTDREDRCKFFTIVNFLERIKDNEKSKMI